MVVHSSLPAALARAAEQELSAAGIEHVAHGDGDPVEHAQAAVDDERCCALIGPYRSAEVSDALEVTAPAKLALLAPVATWAGVTRADEPGCEDAARNAGTTFRLLARDTEVAARLSTWLRSQARRALVVAAGHDYGRQLDGQLRLAGLERVTSATAADVVVLCALAGDDELERLEALGSLPVIAFDGVQGAVLPAGCEPRLALPYAPPEDPRDGGVGRAVHAARLLASAREAGARERGATLAHLRGLPAFDDRGDPVDAPVWLWRADADWQLSPLRAI